LPARIPSGGNITLALVRNYDHSANWPSWPGLSRSSTLMLGLASNQRRRPDNSAQRHAPRSDPDMTKAEI